MDIEKLFNLILNNPDNISIQYSNINGEEKLVVNGKEVTERYDDSEIQEKIAKYRENVELLDDCVFVEALEAYEEDYSIKQFDDLLNKQYLDEEEATITNHLIDTMNTLIHNKIVSKIQNLTDLLERFK